METENNLINIPVGQILEPEVKNYRTYYDAVEMSDLTESIKEVGMISPVTVRKHPVVKGSYELVAGSKRFKAGSSAGLAVIPSVVRDLTDRQVLEIQLIENVQRSNPHPMEEAQAFLQAIEKLGYSVQELSGRLSKSESYVHQRLKLNDLNKDFQKMFYEDKIMFAHAVQLCRLTQEDQKEISSDWKHDPDDVKTPNDLRWYIENEITLNLDSISFDKEDEKLIPKTPSCINCPKRSGYNKSLFNDIEEKDRCFDKGCFDQKLKAHLIKKQAELQASGDTFYLVANNHHPSDASKKEFPDMIVKGSHFMPIDKKKDICNGALKGLVVFSHSGDVGKVIDICTDKKCTKHWDSYQVASVSNANPIEALKIRIKRAKELDDEKVQMRIVEALMNMPALYSTEEQPNKSEITGLYLVLFESAPYHVQNKILKQLKWSKDAGYGESNKIFFKKIKTSTLEERACMIRMVLIERYQNSINSDYLGAQFLREMALERKLPVDQFELDQAAIRSNREKKSKARLKEMQEEAERLEEEKKAAKAEAKKKGAKA
jgi:ParB/RepB/Spo0J family partition protein